MEKLIIASAIVATSEVRRGNVKLKRIAKLFAVIFPLVFIVVILPALMRAA